MSYCHYKWEAEKDSWGSDHCPINIILNGREDFMIQHCAMLCVYTKKTDCDCVIMHWERSEDARNVVKDKT
jgi:hypothetical protein